MKPETPTLQLHRADAALAALADHAGLSTPFATAGWISAFAPLYEPSSLIAVEISHADQSLILPLVIDDVWGVTCARSPGGALANYHAPALSGFLPSLTSETLERALAMAGVDCLLLADCPGDICGLANPLAALAHQHSPDAAHGLRLKPDVDGLLAELFDKDARKKQRQKAKKRTEFGEASARFVEAGPERDEALVMLLTWKAARFAAMGISNPFASEDVQATLKRGLANGSLRLFGLFARERLLAGIIGSVHQGAFSGMLNAHDPAPEIEKTSPGEALLLELVRALGAEGASWFDLGTGEARYKSGFCPAPMPLYDLALGVSLKGRIGARLFLLMRAMKGRIKRSPQAMAWITRARRIKAQF